MGEHPRIPSPGYPWPPSRHSLLCYPYKLLYSTLRFAYIYSGYIQQLSFIIFTHTVGLEKNRTKTVALWSVLRSRAPAPVFSPFNPVLRSRAIFPRLRLQIFFFWLRLQVKTFGSGSTYKSLAPTGSGSKNKQLLIQNI